MPSDIRSFFGGNSAPKENSKPKEPEQPKKRGRPRKVLEDSDDDVPAKKASPKKAAPIKREPTPEGEATTSSAYFGSKKGKKPTAPKKDSGVPAVTITPTKMAPKKTASTTSTPNGRSSARSRKTINYKEEDEFKPDVEMADADADADDQEDEEPVPAKAKPGRKRKSSEQDDDDLDDTPAKKKRAPAKKKANEPKVENAEIKAIFDSIPTVRAPTPPPKDPDAEPSFPFKGPNKNLEAPAGDFEEPRGADNCLAGLSFVFTGQLEKIGREQGQALVKKYGGRVVGAPSKKTDYVVLGNDAGPSKLAKIKENGIKTINEDGLFALIERLPASGGDGTAALAFQEKQKKAVAKAEEEAAAAEAEAKKNNRSSDGHVGGARANEKAPASGPDSRLWTVKYAPTALNHICGNKGQVEKLQRWLKMFPKNQRTGFKMGGADGSGTSRAVIIHGPPGIGKTTAAHLVAKLEGYDVVETNASDSRSKRLVEAGLKGVLSTTSLMGYFSGQGQDVDAAKKKLVLIMDEVDGMSAGDRGGVGALAAVCRKTKIPLILICNDRKQPKMKPFDHVALDLPFRRPTSEQIRSRIMTIAFREKMKLPAPVIDALVEGSRADIRQVVNMISTAKLDQDAEAGGAALDFDSSKQMSKAWEKHVVLKPWDLVSKILAGGLFMPTSKTTLNQKSDLYFNDHEFAPLMLQENYLGSQPPAVTALSGREKITKSCELISKAADSISDGDLVDRVIHGSEQQWSLMPVHAIFSFVRPASFMAGTLAGHQTAFTQWLGKNSSQNKMTRQIKEIQGHMRLKTSGDRHEIRQQYMPLLWSKLVDRLRTEGKDSIQDIVDLMDEYYLTKDDFDSIMELGVGPMAQEGVKLETQTKAAFTRMYNAASHPMPFMKASNVLAPKKLSKEKPDLEEAFDESDEGEVADEDEEKPDAEDDDLTKDKYVKAPKKGRAAAKGKGAKKGDAGLDDGDDEDQKPQKGKGRGRGRGKK